MDEEIEGLKDSMRSTAASRFNAAKRLYRIDVRLTALTAFTSALIILLSVAPYIWPVSDAGDRLTASLTIALSLTMLASSLLQFASNHAVQAELHHRSALQIQDLRRKLKVDALSGNVSSVEFKNYCTEYAEILERYALNHDDVDFDRYRIENSDRYHLTAADIRWLEAKRWMANHYPSVVLAIVLIFSVIIMWIAFIIPDALIPPA